MKSEVEFRLKDIEILNNMNAFGKSLVGFYDFAARNITKLTDKYLPKHEYYNYQQPSSTSESVEVVLDRVYEEMEQIDNQYMDAAINAREEQLAVGGNIDSSPINVMKKLDSIGHAANTAIKDTAKPSPVIVESIAPTTTKSSAKARFYANFDYNLRQEQRSGENRERYRSEVEVLRREVSMSAESVAIDLLGQPNRKLSRGSTLKYGTNGSLAIKIQGSKAGTWYDFSESKGGDLFDLVRQEKHCDFKQAVNYLQDRLGIKANIGRPSLQAVNDHVIADKLIDHYQQMAQEKAEEASKISKAVRLYAKSAAIELNSTASHYLGQVRKIDIDLAKERLSDDIRTTNIYEQSLSLKLPALLAFARDASGKITGGQQILLDSKTNDKADIEVAKRSFGKIAGSFVEVGSLDNNRETQTTNRTITIIAEGLETALSVRQALIHGQAHQDKQITILCSLGISNIKNYQPVCGEKIIIAADNDGSKAVTNITIDSAKEELISKGAFVEIVRPSNPGDFNDLLKENAANSGEKAIQAVFNKALNKHAAVTLEQYFSHNDQGQNLTKQEKANISYIEQFKINEEKIIDAYRICPLKGCAKLDDTRKSIEFADNFVDQHKYLINEANAHGAKLDKKEVVVSLVGKNYDEMEQSLVALRDKHCIIDNLAELAETKQKAKTPEQALRALANEQQYLANLHLNRKDHNYKEYDYNGNNLLKSIKHAYHNEKDKVFEQLYKLKSYIDKATMKPEQITDTIKNSAHSASALRNLTKQYQAHVIYRIKQHLDDIHSGKELIIEGRSFTCQVKLLDYALKTYEHNEFFPRDHIQKGRDNFFAHQKELSKEIGGFSL